MKDEAGEVADSRGTDDELVNAVMVAHLKTLAMREQRDMLGHAIGAAAIKAGIIGEGSELTGPHLLMLCENLADMAIRRAANVSDQLRRAAGEVLDLFDSGHTNNEIMRLAMEDLRAELELDEPGERDEP
jgi:hypothetical protein